jgi:hypothetical protein
MAGVPRIDIPVACPICGLSAVERVFHDFAMIVKGPEKDKTVRAIAAFICRVNGHLFFVRMSDLGTCENLVFAGIS